MKKKIISLFLAITLMSAMCTPVCNAAYDVVYNLTQEEMQYDNIINEYNLLVWYIEEGLYLETISLCDELERTKNLSPEDKSIVEEFRLGADLGYSYYQEGWDEAAKLIAKAIAFSYQGLAVAYDILINEIENVPDEEVGLVQSYMAMIYGGIYEYQEYESYDIPGWGMSVRNLFIPRISDDGEFYFLQRSSNGIVTIFRDDNYWGDVKSYVCEEVSQIKDKTAYFESISEGYTSAGRLQAYQATFRTAINGGHLTIFKIVSTKYNNKVYSFIFAEYGYMWSEEFWNEMETIRTGVSFY